MCDYGRKQGDISLRHPYWGLGSTTTQVMLLHLILTKHTLLGVLGMAFLACLWMLWSQGTHAPK